MILTTPHKPMTLVGATSQSFTIESSAKAFQILSSSIYKNPIRAIVRELSCNALDSHTSAVNPSPFEIHLPNVFESWFSIRDFGTGIAESDIQTIYTTYFRSTKTNSNAQVGALGLGSKSPFSYTETFTVTSWSEGTKSQYIAFINSSGAPCLSHVGSEYSDSPSGFEVLFEVKPQDFNTFVDEASVFFSTWSATFPKIIGGILTNSFVPIDNSSPTTMVGSDWTITFHNQRHKNTPIVVQGNVPYPIDTSAAFPVTQGTPISPELKLFIEACTTQNPAAFQLVVTVPIGALDFAPSREELQYTSHTKEQLALVCTRVIRELTDQLHAQLDAGGGSKFLTALAYGNASQPQLLGTRRVVGLADTIREGLLKLRPYLVDGVPFRSDAHIVVPKSVLVELDATLKIRMNVLATMPAYNPNDKTRFDRDHTVYTFPNRITKFMVVVKDDAMSALDKIKYNYLRTTSASYDSSRQIVLIEKKHSKITQLEFDSALDKYLTALGGFPASSVVLSSTLTPAPTSTKSKSSFEYLVWTGRVHNTRKRYSGYKTPASPYSLESWTQPTDQLTSSQQKTVLYIPRRGHSIVDPVTGETSYHTKLFGEHFLDLQKLGLFGDNVVVIGVQPKHIKGVPSSWESVYSYIKRELALILSEEVAQAEITKAFGDQNSRYRSQSGSVVARLLKYYSKQLEFPIGFSSAVDTYRQLVGLGTRPRPFDELDPHALRTLGLNFGVTCTPNQHPILIALKKDERLLTTQYPMLTVVDDTFAYSDIQTLTTYIKLVDNSTTTHESL
jgi:hypothetical protein